MIQPDSMRATPTRSMNLLKIPVMKKATASNKRAAQSKVVQMIVSGVGHGEVADDPRNLRQGT